MNNDKGNDKGFVIVNDQPKTCDEIHAECRKYAAARPAHKPAVFECSRCGEQFRSK